MNKCTLCLTTHMMSVISSCDICVLCLLYLLVFRFHDDASLIHFPGAIWVTALLTGPLLFLLTSHAFWPLITSLILLPVIHAMREGSIAMNRSSKKLLSSHAFSVFGTGFNFRSRSEASPRFKTSANIPSFFPSNLSVLPRLVDRGALMSESNPLRPFFSLLVSSITRSPIIPGNNTLRLPLFTDLSVRHSFLSEQPLSSPITNKSHEINRHEAFFSVRPILFKITLFVCPAETSSYISVYSVI